MKNWFLVLGMVLCLTLPTSVTANEKTIGPNEVVRDSLSDSNRSDRFQMTLPSAGHIDIDLEHGEHDLDIFIERDGKKMDLPYTYGPTGIVLSGALESGTYVLTVENSYQWDKEQRPYRLATSFRPANNHEMEPNQEVSSSTLLPLNKWQTGFLSNLDKIDMYQIDLKKGGSLNLSFESLANAPVDITLIDQRNRKIYGQRIYENETDQVMVDLEPGSYYLRVGDEDGYQDGYGGIYNLNASLKAANNVEKEMNNTLRSANAFPFFKRQTGFLSWNDNIDYYTFTLPKTSKVSIDLRGPSNTWSNFMVFNAKGESLHNSVSLSEAQRFTKTYSLVKGTYYLAIERSTFDLLGGVYQLQINSTHLYPVLSVNKVTTKSTTVTGKTEKGATVTMTIGKKSYNRKADAKGNYSFKVSKQKSGTVIKITAKNKYGSTIKTTKVTTK